MANEALIKVNGVALSTPSDIKVEIQDLDGESVRPVATGVLRRNRIRSNMLKVTLTWNMTQNYLFQLMESVPLEKCMRETKVIITLGRKRDLKLSPFLLH